MHKFFGIPKKAEPWVWGAVAVAALYYLSTLGRKAPPGGGGGGGSVSAVLTSWRKPVQAYTPLDAVGGVPVTPPYPRRAGFTDDGYLWAASTATSAVA